MEAYLPIIQAIVSDWLQLTLNNPLYAAALALVVWLLTALIYRIKVSILKKKTIAGEKARIELQQQLDNTQLKIQEMQKNLASKDGQMQEKSQLLQNEAQRASSLHNQLVQRNEAIASVLQALASRFDLGEPPLPLTEDIKAEELWQQHDRVIALLTNRLRSEQQAKMELQHSHQAESAKRAEQEVLIEQLQASLAAHVSEITKLEQALEEQNLILQQQADQSQQALEKHQAELTRFTELEQQSQNLINARQAIMQLEENLNAKEALITQLQKDQPVDQIKVQTQPAAVRQGEEKMGFELKAPDERVTSALLAREQQAVKSVKEQAGRVSGKIKSLFGKTGSVPIMVEADPAETDRDEAETQSTPSNAEQQPVNPVKGQLGKIKNLFGKHG